VIVLPNDIFVLCLILSLSLTSKIIADVSTWFIVRRALLRTFVTAGSVTLVGRVIALINVRTV
jgi:hypothetical protein